MAPVGPCGQRGPGAVGALRGVPVFVLRLRAGCAFRVVSPVAFAPAVRLGLARSDRVSRGVLPLAAFVPRRPSPARRVRAEADHGFSARAFGGVPASRSRRSASSPRRLRLSPRVFAQASLSSSPSLPRVRVARPQPCRPALAAPPRTAFRSRRRPRARAAPRGRDAEAGCRLCRLRAAFVSVGREPASAGCGAASAALFASCLPPPLACVFASVVRLGLGRWGRASRGVLSLAASSSRAAVVRAPRSRRSVASPRQPTLRLAGFPPAADAIPPCPGPRLRRAAARRRPALAGSSPRRLPGGLFAGGGHWAERERRLARIPAKNGHLLRNSEGESERRASAGALRVVWHQKRCVRYTRARGRPDQGCISLGISKQVARKRQVLCKEGRRRGCAGRARRPASSRWLPSRAELQPLPRARAARPQPCCPGLQRGLPAAYRCRPSPCRASARAARARRRVGRRPRRPSAALVPRPTVVLAAPRLCEGLSRGAPAVAPRSRLPATALPPGPSAVLLRRAG